MAPLTRKIDLSGCLTEHSIDFTVRHHLAQRSKHVLQIFATNETILQIKTMQRARTSNASTDSIVIDDVERFFVLFNLCLIEHGKYIGRSPLYAFPRRLVRFETCSHTFETSRDRFQ